MIEAKPPKIYQSLGKAFLQPENILLLHTPALPLPHALAHALYHDTSRLIILVDTEPGLLSELNHHLHLLKREKTLSMSDSRGDSPQVIPVNKVVREKRSKLYLQGGIYSLTLQIALLDVLSADKDLNPHDVGRIIVFHSKNRRINDFYAPYPWLMTLFSLNRNQSKVVFVSQHPDQMNGDNLEQTIRWLFLKKIVLWPFGRKQIHQSLTHKSIPSTSHRLNFNQRESNLHDFYTKLLKYCNENDHDMRQIKQLQNLLIDDNKLQHLQRVMELSESACGIWNNANTQIVELIDCVVKEAKNCVFNLLLVKGQAGEKGRRVIDLSKIINTEKIIGEANQKEGSESPKKQVYFELYYELNVVGLREETVPVLPAKLIEIMSHFQSRYSSEDEKQEGIDESDADVRFLSSQMRSESAVVGLQVYVSTNRERTAENLKRYMRVFNSKTEYAEYLRDLLRFLEMNRERRLESIRKSIIKIVNPSAVSRNNKFRNENLRIEEEEPILLEELYCELKAVDEVLVHYASIHGEEQSMKKELNRMGLMYVEISRLQVRSTETQEDGCICKFNKVKARFSFHKNESIYELNQFLRVLAPQICIFYDFNTAYIRNVSIQYSQGATIGLEELHALYFEGSCEDEKVHRSVKEEDRSFWNIGEERKKLGQYSEQPEIRIKELIINDEIHKKARMISLADGLAKSKKDDQRNLVPHWVNPDKLFRVKVERTILIDKRQFKSKLPSFLFHYGFTVIPVFLEVGDYILSNQIALERKAVQTFDLQESLRSGRLFEQSKKMSLKFGQPHILIECPDQSYFSSRAFNSQVSQITGEKYQTNTLKQTCQLLSRFPKLGVIWSCSYLETVEYIMELKKNELEPEVRRFKPTMEGVEWQSEDEIE